MLQIIHEVTKRDRPDIKVSLIFANVTEKDILLREELATITERFSNIKVFFTLDRPEPGWPGGSGFVTPEMIKQHLPPPSPETQILVCGPPPMVNFVASHLAALQYPDESVYKY
jgi:cytochrome-b5 reductase